MNYVIKLGERFLIETRNKHQGNEIAQVEHTDIDYYDIVLVEGEESSYYQVSFNQEKYDAKQIVIANEIAAKEAAQPYNTLKEVIRSAIAFGQNLILDFATENVILEITQNNMTGTVLTRMSGVTNALNTGSLYEAITLIKAIPNEHKDAIYITNARLLEYANKIETYLGVELSTEL